MIQFMGYLLWSWWKEHGMLEKACFAELCSITSLTGKSPNPKGSSLRTHGCTRYDQVAFLECDLGQSEFTPGGMVSLHAVSQPVFGKDLHGLLNAYFSIKSFRTSIFPSFRTSPGSLCRVHLREILSRLLSRMHIGTC